MRDIAESETRRIRGIIHRDIKPTNVLVALYDDRPVPKVIDFGVAKATGLQLTDASLVTGFGAVVGTPEYMSPEQAQLYELLTCTTPIHRKRLAQGAVFEVLRIIREEEPPKPSTRINTMGPTCSAVAAQRLVDPSHLGQLIRGELDWIVMKCLEKDRSRRYATANGLAHDLERYMSDEPVEAGRPSASYRLRKLVPRHRTALVTAAGFASLLVAAVIVSTWFAFGERFARGVADNNAALAAESAERATNEAEEARQARSVADQQRRQADEQRAIAESEKRRADQRQKEVQQERDRAAAEAESANKARAVAEKERREAEAQRKIAVEQRTLAEDQKRRADANATAAERGRKEAEFALKAAEQEKRRADLEARRANANFAVAEQRRREADLHRDRAKRALYANQIATDQRSWEMGDVIAAWCSLNACKAEFRGWEHRYLRTLFTRKQKTLHGHTGPVSGVALSPDGSLIASGSFDKTVKLWDAVSGREILTFRGHKDWVRCAAFCPNGRQIASAGGDKTVKLWDATNGREIHALKGHEGTVSGVVFSPDGKLIASCSLDSTVRVWSVASGQEIRTFRGHTSNVACVAFNPDGKRIASGSFDNIEWIRQAICGYAHGSP